MATLHDMTGQFIPGANVGNLLSVRLVVVTGIIKPDGALMV